MTLKLHTIGLCLALLTLCLIKCGCRDMAYAGQIPNSTAIRCILGEAGGTTYWEMLTISRALRNRGTINGVYGCFAQISADEASWRDQTGLNAVAKAAWEASAKIDLSHGATHWGALGLDDDWISQMRADGYIETKKTKFHVYFKKPVAKQF